MSYKDLNESDSIKFRIALGEEIARVFQLKIDKKTGLVETTHGKKAMQGIGSTVIGFIETMSLMGKILLVDGARGIYVPQNFAVRFADNILAADNPTHYSDIQENLAILKSGPDNDDYWEAIADIERDAVLDIEGRKYTIHQDGDLWALPIGYEEPE